MQPVGHAATRLGKTPQQEVPPMSRLSRTASTRVRRVGLLLLAAALISGAFAAPSRAALNIHWYSHSTTPCDSSTWTDPITVIFYGNASEPTTSNLIGDYTGWGDTILDGDSQLYWNDGYCDANQGSRADGASWQSRYHIRMTQKRAYDPDYWLVTMGTPHYEVITECGHAVRYTDVNNWGGFDMGRQRIMEAFDGHNYHFVKYVGNSGTMVQCNGWFASSNGNVRYISIT